MDFSELKTITDFSTLEFAVCRNDTFDHLDDEAVQR